MVRSSLLYALAYLWYMFQLNNDPQKVVTSESSNRKKLLNTKLNAELLLFELHNDIWIMI